MCQNSKRRLKKINANEESFYGLNLNFPRRAGDAGLLQADR